MMIKRDVFDVYLDPADGTVDPDTGEGAAEHRVTLTHGDTLRAELEGHKRAIPLHLSMHMTSLMLWAACVRLGHYTDTYDAFRNGGLIEYARVAQDGPDATVDPTREVAPSGPASPSPLTSPDSWTGSTPT